jgi:hypothetical protein
VDGAPDSAWLVVAGPVFALRIIVPPILYMGLVEVEAGWIGVDCPDFPPDCLEELLLCLRSLNTPLSGGLTAPEIWKEPASSFPCELNARDKVLGRKNPSFPKGMLSPCTTWECQLILQCRLGGTCDAADCQEPNHHHHNFSKLLCVSTLNSIYSDGLQELQGDVQVEYGRYANRSEKADEYSLTLLLDLMNNLVHCKNHRETP